MIWSTRRRNGRRGFVLTGLGEAGFLLRIDRKRKKAADRREAADDAEGTH